jgi:Holliday junction resolvase-like predicted endonuclease
MTLEIKKSSRHSDIAGRFGENLILYWLSKYGFESCNINHTGIDIIASNSTTKERMGISVKCRSREEGKKSEISINKQQLNLMDIACEAFGCTAYFAFVIDTSEKIQIFILKKEKFLQLSPSTTYCGWKMAEKHVEKYKNDKDIKITEFHYKNHSWFENKIEKNHSSITHSLTGFKKQQLFSKMGFEFKDIKEVPLKIASYSPSPDFNGIIYSRHENSFNTKNEAKMFGIELKKSRKITSIRIGNGIKVAGNSRKEVFFVYYLSANGKPEFIKSKIIKD